MHADSYCNLLLSMLDFPGLLAGALTTLLVDALLAGDGS